MDGFDNVGIRLKTARMAAGFKSAKQFCDKHQISSSTYSLHETGGRNIKPKVAERYSKLLGINAVWLLTGAGSPYAKLADERPLSHDEFAELLKHQGVEAVKTAISKKNAFLEYVDPLLFCEIVIRMINILQSKNFHLETIELSKKAVEIYKDISISSDDREAQVTMIELAMTTFKRKISELDNERKKTVNQ
jgi:hypothetical protein